MSRGFSFVPPTNPEAAVKDSSVESLIVSIPDGQQPGPYNAFGLFELYGSYLLSQSDTTPEDIVIELQHESGRSLDTRGAGRLLAWVQEETRRQDLPSNLSTHEIIKQLWGHETADFEDLARRPVDDIARARVAMAAAGIIPPNEALNESAQGEQ